jgi:hypothetical protein
MHFLPADLVNLMVSIVPETYELAGVFHVDRSGRLRDVTINVGPPCVDASTGKHTRQCHVEMPPRRGERDIVWHTHPASNRPSSIDMEHAMEEAAPAPSYVFSRHGAWAYWPVRGVGWDKMTERDRRRTVLMWRVVGGLLESPMQRRCPDAIRRFSDTVLPHVGVSFTANH